VSQQLEAIAIAIWDPKIKAWTGVDADLLRAIVLGIKKLVDLSVKAVVTANSTESALVDVWKSDDQLVIKSVEVSGVPQGNSVSKVTLTVDGVSYDITKTGDLEANYGSKIYGTVVQVKVTLTNAVSADTTLTITVRGFNAGKIQVPA